MQNKITLLLLFFILQFSVVALAQTDYSAIKVDNLTDAQVLQILRQAENGGVNTFEKFQNLALQKGMKQEEISKFKLRAEKLNPGKYNSTVNPLNTNNSKNTNLIDPKLNELNLKGEEEDLNKRKKRFQKDLTDTLPKIFGSDLFQNTEMTFEPNLRLATPKGYVVGPDDNLIIDVTGENEVSYTLDVSTDGSINIPYVGRIAVAGLSIDQSISKIKAAMSKIYPAMHSGRTALAINLGNVRSIQVILTGQVYMPGTYTLSSLSSAFNALYHAGGPSEKGTYRNIQLIRNNKVILTIDLYDFLLKGIQKGNVRLQDQDVIHVPVLNKQVLVSGEVNTPAYFEMKNQETLQDLVMFAGGFSSKAYSARLKVIQNTSKEHKIIDVSSENFNSYLPNNGDQVVVEQILERFQNRVEIKGAVFRPGEYQLSPGLTLKQLIEKADGLKEDAFLNRGYITRLNSDNTINLLSFDVKKILSGEEKDVMLLREDKITISSIFDLRDEYEYTIQGEVRYPGTFPFAENTNLEDLIQMAGGFKTGATPNRVEISRRVLNSDVTSANASTAEIFTVNVDENLMLVGPKFNLKPFDIVSVRNAEGYMVQKQVRIEGEVLYPGLYTIVNKSERISDIIKRAGGLTLIAYSAGASLKRPGPKTDQKHIDDKTRKSEEEEDKQSLLLLKSADETGVKNEAVEEKIIQSDLVGIQLEKILKTPLSNYDLILEDGDVINIPKQLQTVKITGEVLNPNNVIYADGKGIRTYIRGAGGFSTKAYKKGVFVKYANGSVQGKRKFLFFSNNPSITPGAEIMVPKKADREKLTPQNWIGISTALASLGAIIVSILR